jgi:Protein of unknown function (DUF3604)
VIGSTDSHTGLSIAAEPYFWGKFPTDSTLDGKRRSTNRIENFGWAMSASGLAGVWAEENSRKANLAAFRRREVYATTGSRIALRAFAGADYQAADAESGDPAALRARGVPMGGVLARSEAPPRILVQAMQDMSAPLERIQIVKGWLASGSVALGIDPAETGHPEMVQERAYGSAIHYPP